MLPGIILLSGIAGVLVTVRPHKKLTYTILFIFLLGGAYYLVYGEWYQIVWVFSPFPTAAFISAMIELNRNK